MASTYYSDPNYRTEGDNNVIHPPQSSPPKQSNGFDYNALLTGSRAPSLDSVNPYTDASYNNFFRGFGFDKAQVGAQTARSKQALEAQLEQQRPVWADQLNRGLGTIGDNAENNGVFQSGKRLQDQANFQTDQARAQSSFENGIRGQQADADVSAQMQLQALARQQAEQELAARSRVAQTQMSAQTNPILQQLLMSALQG